MKKLFPILLFVVILSSCEKLENEAMPEIRITTVNGKPYTSHPYYTVKDTVIVEGDLHAEAGIKFFNFFFDTGNGNNYFHENVEASNIPGMPLESGFDSKKDHHFKIVIPPNTFKEQQYWFYLVDEDGKTRAVIAELSIH